MQITTQRIIELEPCNDRLQNYLKHYKNFSGSIIDFLELDKITYSDKIWVCRHLLPLNLLQKWSVSVAESVKHIYNDKYPNDNRINECIEYTLKFINNECTEEELLEKRRNVADAANATNATDATDAAYAAYAAAYAACAAADAACAAADATDATKMQQQKLNLILLVDLIETEGV